MKLYLSGPMTGVPEFNIPEFARVAALLRAEGHDVSNPGELGIFVGWEWVDYLRLDLRLLLDCEAVATLPGWEKSRGASLEVHVATSLGMRALPWQYWTGGRDEQP